MVDIIRQDFEIGEYREGERVTRATFTINDGNDVSHHVVFRPGYTYDRDDDESYAGLYLYNLVSPYRNVHVALDQAVTIYDAACDALASADAPYRLVDHMHVVVQQFSESSIDHADPPYDPPDRPSDATVTSVSKLEPTSSIKRRIELELQDGNDQPATAQFSDTGDGFMLARLDASYSDLTTRAARACADIYTAARARLEREGATFDENAQFEGGQMP